MPQSFPRRARRLLLAIGAVLSAAVALTAWALASPVGSSPDDDFHLISIWCAGDGSALCAPASDPDEREVDLVIAVDAVCHAYDPEASARCQPDLVPADSTGVTDRGNFTGVYPPLFYGTMSLFAGHDIAASVILMRLVSVALVLTLATATFLLLPTPRRPVLVGAIAVTIVPMGMFIVPSTNPSSWAFISTAVTWIALLGWFETKGKQRVGLGVLAVLGAVVGAGARADAGLYAVLGVVVVAVLTVGRGWRRPRDSIVPAAIVAIGAASWFSSGQAAAATGGLGGRTELTLADTVNLVLTNLALMPEFLAGTLSGPLGWLDVPLPLSVAVLNLIVFGGVAALGLVARGRRELIAIAIVALALWILPLYLLVQSRAVVGSYVQPRYVLPIVTILAGLLLLRALAHGPQSWSRVGPVAGAVALTAANALALHATIRRYTTGIDETGLNLNAGIEWWWNIPLSPMVAWIVGSLAFACALTTLLFGAVRVPGAERAKVLETTTG